MKIQQRLKTSLTKFLSDQAKVLLLIHENAVAVSESLASVLAEEKVHYVSFDLSQPIDIESKLASLPTNRNIIIIFDGLNAQMGLYNLYLKYQLDRWPVKVIVLCPNNLLHVSLDPSIYFAPIQGERVQRHLLCKFDFANHPPPAQLNSPSITQVAADNPKKPIYAYRDDFLNQMLMTNDSMMMQMLADRALHSEYFKEFLLKIIYVSREDERLQIAAANAITALNYAKVPFSGMDLSLIRIPHADLTGSVLHETNLSGANLTDCCLRQSFVHGCNFSQANLDRIDLGQLPPLESCGWPFAFSQDGKWLAAVSKKDQENEIVMRRREILVYAIVENCPQFKFKLTVPYDNVHIVVFNKNHFDEPCITALCEIVNNENNRHLSFENYLLTWTLDKRELISECEVSVDVIDARIHEIYSSFDGIWLAFQVNRGSNERESYIYTLNVNTINLTFLIKSAAFKQMCFNVHNDQLVMIDDRNIKIWSVNAAQWLTEFPIISDGNVTNDTDVIGLAAHPTEPNRFAAAFEDGHIQLWDVHRKLLITTYERHLQHKKSHLSNKFVFSPNGNWLVMVCSINKVAIWDITRKEPFDKLIECVEMISEIVTHPLGQYMAIGCTSVDAGYYESIRFWEMDFNKNKSNKLNENSGMVNAVCLSADGQLIASSHKNNMIQLRRVRDGVLLKTILPKEPTLDIFFNSTHTHLIFIENENCKIWDIEKNDYIETNFTKHTIGQVKHACVSLDRKWLVLGGKDGILYLAELETEHLIIKSLEQASIKSMDNLCVSPKCEWVAIIHVFKPICLYNRKTDSFLTLPQSTKRTICASFSRHGRWLATGSYNLQIWNMDDQKVSHMKTLMVPSANEANQVTAVSFSADPATDWLLVFSTSDRMVVLSNVLTGEMLATLKAHERQISSLDFGLNGILVTGSHDESVNCWQIKKYSDNKREKYAILQCWSTRKTLTCEQNILSKALNLSENNRRVLTGKVNVPSTKHYHHAGCTHTSFFHPHSELDSGSHEHMGEHHHASYKKDDTQPTAGKIDASLLATSLSQLLNKPADQSQANQQILFDSNQFHDESGMDNTACIIS